jgi:hypothetical protein
LAAKLEPDNNKYWNFGRLHISIDDIATLLEPKYHLEDRLTESQSNEQLNADQDDHLVQVILFPP